MGSMQRKVKNSYVIDKEHMKMIFEEEFFKEATKKSYTEKWVNDYLEICEKS